MKKTKLIFFILFSFFISGYAYAAAPPPQLYITQVQITGGAGNTNADFIELFNPNSTAVNLKGYRLVKRSQNSQSDTDIKSWTKDAIIPAKSFYLWANSGYTLIAAKPDVTTSASLSDDNGVAIRFGIDNSGQLIDSLSWGNANVAFPNVSKTNPGANQALFRKDWYEPNSSYSIAASTPRNSQITDVAAAYQQSVKPAQAPTVAGTKNPVTQPSVIPSQPQLDATASPTQTDISGVFHQQNQPVNAYQNYTKPKSASNYLILAGAALLALAFLGYKFFWNKK